jgi:hypothetical protein
MSLLINESYAQPDVPIWLGSGIASDRIVAMTPSAQGFLQAGNPLAIASYTYSKPVNYVKLQGWVQITGDANVSTVNMFLSTGLGYSASNSTRLENVSIINGNVFLCLDNLILCSPTPFTTVYLVLQNTGGVGVLVTPTPVSLTNTYTSLPSVSGWTNPTQGSILAISGVV